MFVDVEGGENVGWAETARTAPVTEATPFPRTVRARRTHDRLVVAARSVFEEVGYLDAFVDTIVERAGVAHGTFYTYFPSKLAVFRQVAVSLGEEVLSGSEWDEPAPRTIYERVYRTNRRYFEYYRRNARLMEILEQVAALDDEMREVRRAARVQFVERSTRFVARLQSEGLAQADLDPGVVASALGSMVDRTAYVCFVLGEPHDFDEVVNVVSALYVRALGIEPSHP